MLLSLFCVRLSAQDAEVSKLRDPKGNYSKVCERYIEFEREYPVEESVYIDYSGGYLFINITDKSFAKKLVKKRLDGFAIDVISKEQYTCEGDNQLNDSWAHKGTLLPPLFKKKFRRDIKSQMRLKAPDIRIRYGKLPKEFDPNQVEFNLLILNKRWRCDYRQYTNLEEEGWNLLPTGLYRDSIPPTVGTLFEDLKKVVTFTVPFEQNETTVKPAHIKPLYDSLNFTDYIIRKIRIRAFASVEGSKVRNLELQEGRAQSIVEALQSYQSEQVASTVSSRENWDQFYKEVAKTPFSYLATLSETEVKETLSNDKDLRDRLMPMLASHRKAEIEVSLEKRLTVETNDPAKLKAYFDRRIKEENIEEALFIQQVIFQKIKDARVPEDFIHELEIPKSAGYAPLLNNDISFKNERKALTITQTLDEFIKISQLIPDRPKIQFNIITLKLQLWKLSNNARLAADVESRFRLLNQSELNPVLVARLRMNYNILKANYYFNRKAYKKKNAVLAEIYNNYRQIHLTDKERLSMAYYLSFYSRYKEARNILKTRATAANTTNDILFYYLSMVITNPNGQLPLNYVRLLNRAAERDSVRFCALFEPISMGGLSFQLLEDPDIKTLYCQVCEH